MRRLRLAGKLALASLPIGLAALLATGYLAWTFLGDARVHDETARASTVASQAMVSIRTLWSEEQLARAAFLEGDETAEGNLAPAKGELDIALNQLDAAVLDLRSLASTESIDMVDDLAADVSEVRTSIEGLRSIVGPTVLDLQTYEIAAKTLLGIVSQTSLQIDDRVRARELIASQAMAEAAFDSFEQEQLVRGYLAGSDQTLEAVEEALTAREVAFGDWLLRAAEASPAAAAQLSTLMIESNTSGRVEVASFPLDRTELLVVAAEGLANQASAAASAEARETRIEAIALGGGSAVVLLLAGWATIAIGRSLVRRVRVVTDAAKRVAEVDLPNLVQALRHPDEQFGDSQPAPISAAGGDEVGELARSFSALHGTLFDVARQQMDILRKGVSEIFVTLARRNRELVDRQLALIDQLESREEDPEVLGGYFKLDHLATRMRRNAESLLVLAGTDTTRMWAQPLDIGDVVRAALGEVEDFQRVEVLALEPVQVSGGVVADLSHLLSEILDNATQFSAPSDRVRVTGLFDQDGYLVTISDHGVGMTDARMGELNRLLAKPPVLGLALDPTLGLYVVARLAARHGISIRLVHGVPGLTVRVTIPRTKLKVAPQAGLDAPSPDPEIPFIGESRHVVAARENGSFTTGERRRTRQRLAGHEREDEGVSQVLPLRSAGRYYRSDESQTPEAAPAPTHLPVQLISNGLSLTGEPKASGTTNSSGTRGEALVRSHIETSAGLPTRVPGTSYTETSSNAQSSGKSEMGPDGIKAALNAYQVGRTGADLDHKDHSSLSPRPDEPQNLDNQNSDQQTPDRVNIPEANSPENWPTENWPPENWRT
jgi:hypothetical protein